MKQTIIILIGHDTSGKSHISKALSEKLNLPIWKMATPKKFWDPIIAQRYSQEVITQMCEQLKNSVIFDRGFPCDWMYAKLFNRHYDFEKALETDVRFSKMNTLIVLCYKNKINQQYDEEDKDFVNIEDYDKMTQLYLTFLQNSLCKHITINTSDENLEEQLETIIKNI